MLHNPSKRRKARRIADKIKQKDYVDTVGASFYFGADFGVSVDITEEMTVIRSLQEEFDVRLVRAPTGDESIGLHFEVLD